MSNNFQQQWGQGQQQPNVFGQSTNFTPGNQDFPTLAQQPAGANTQQQFGTQQAANPVADNPFASVSSAGFTPSAAEFVPTGVIAGKEEFPDLDQAFGGGGSKKSKKAVPSKAQIEADKLAAQAALPTKGQPAVFFMHQGQATQEQMIFVFQHYPQYSANPCQILDWLYGEAMRIQFEEEAKNQLEQQAYGQPSRANKNYNNNEYYEEEVNYDEDSSFGISSHKQVKKGGASQKSKQNPNAVKEKQEKNEKLVVKQENQVKTKFIKDVVVKVDEEAVDVDESRQPCSLVFIGHVDAGKSTISGQIMYLMGCVDERTIEKYQREAKDKGRDSWWLAYCMDVGEEEKAKGKTVEVGRATFDTPSKQFTVFDAPGHKNYVPNMIMGAALADFAGLVISARKGEFEAGFEKDGQTREHVQLAKSLGVQKLVVIVNKMDEPSVQWSETRWNEIKTKLGPFLEKSGYPPADVQYVPISGLQGHNIKEKIDAKVCKWYSGPTLMEILDGLPIEKRDPNGPLRMPVLDKVKEQGVVAHGKIESGTMHVGDKIQVAPSGFPAQIGMILDHKNESVKFARPGENVQITLIHIVEENMVQKGDVLTSRDASTMCPVTMLFEAEIETLELLESKMIICKGYSCVMHCHTFADDIVIKDLLSVTEKSLASGKEETKDAPKFIKSFSKAKVRITCKVPLAAEKFDVLPQLGRFTLRDEGRTIAVGKILKYKPHKVESSIQVAGGNTNAQNTKNDKNEALVFDGESGQVVQPKKALDSIAEE